MVRRTRGSDTSGVEVSQQDGDLADMNETKTSTLADSTPFSDVLNSTSLSSSLIMRRSRRLRANQGVEGSDTEIVTTAETAPSSAASAAVPAPLDSDSVRSRSRRRKSLAVLLHSYSAESRGPQIDPENENVLDAASEAGMHCSNNNAITKSVGKSTGKSSAGHRACEDGVDVSVTETNLSSDKVSSASTSGKAKVTRQALAELALSESNHTSECRGSSSLSTTTAASKQSSLSAQEQTLTNTELMSHDKTIVVKGGARGRLGVKRRGPESAPSSQPHASADETTTITQTYDISKITEDSTESVFVNSARAQQGVNNASSSSSTPSPTKQSFNCSSSSSSSTKPSQVSAVMVATETSQSAPPSARARLRERWAKASAQRGEGSADCKTDQDATATLTLTHGAQSFSSTGTSTNSEVKKRRTDQQLSPHSGLAILPGDSEQGVSAEETSCESGSTSTSRREGAPSAVSSSAESTEDVTHTVTSFTTGLTSTMSLTTFINNIASQATVTGCSDTTTSSSNNQQQAVESNVCNGQRCKLSTTFRVQLEKAKRALDAHRLLSKQEQQEMTNAFNDERNSWAQEREELQRKFDEQARALHTAQAQSRQHQQAAPSSPSSIEKTPTVRNLVAALAEAKAKVLELEKLAAGKEAEAETLRVTNAQLTQTTATLQQDLQCCMTAKEAEVRSHLDAKAAWLEEKAAKMQMEADGNAQLIARENELHKLQSSVQSLQSKCDNYKSTVIAFKQAMGDLEAEVKDHKDALDRESAKRKQLEVELQQLEKELSTTRLSEAELSNRVDELVGSRDKFAAEVERLKEVCGSLERSLQERTVEYEGTKWNLEQERQRNTESVQNLKDAHDKQLRLLATETVAEKASMQSAFTFKLAEMEAQRNLALEEASTASAQLSAALESQASANAALSDSTATATRLAHELAEIKENLETRVVQAVEEGKQARALLEQEVETLKRDAVYNDQVRRQLHNELIDLRGNIRVFCRIRPLSTVGETGVSGSAHPPSTQPTMQFVPIASRTGPNGASLTEELEVHMPSESITGIARNQTATYKFDKVFAPSDSQKQLFRELSGFVESALDGYSVSVFAYGQTGSGKTHTMMGPEECFARNGSALRMSDERGVIPRTVEQIFEGVAKKQSLHWEFRLKASFLEIYNEQIRDLLAHVPGYNCTGHPLMEAWGTTTTSASTSASSVPSSSQQGVSLFASVTSSTTSNTSEDGWKVVQDRSGRVYVADLKAVPVSSPSDVYALLREANANRTTAATASNSRSSRSHSVFQLWITGRYVGPQNNATEGVSAKPSAPAPIASILSLVDLAGSERLEKSKAEGPALKEAQHINTSLSTLSHCMDAIAAKRDHIPYRNSKLTYLLKDSLGGSSKTLFFTNISSDPIHGSESLCTLRFAEALRGVELGPRGLANSTSSTTGGSATSNQSSATTSTAALSQSNGGQSRPGGSASFLHHDKQKRFNPGFGSKHSSFGAR